jgi:hypothetical protein
VTHRATQPTHDRDDRIPLRVMTLERDLAAQIAHCRECRTHRERWESGMAKEFAEFRHSITRAVASGLEKLENKFDATPTKRRLKSRG